MYVYGKYSRDSVHARGPMTNSKYVLGPGTGKQISPYNKYLKLSQISYPSCKKLLINNTKALTRHIFDSVTLEP